MIDILHDDPEGLDLQDARGGEGLGVASLMPLGVELRATTALELPAVSPEHLDILRQLIAPYLGAGFVLAIDGAIVARGPEAPEPPPADSSSQQVQRLTEMAVQHHEYLCAELRRMREEYEQEFAQERAAMRTLRQRWMERICDDQVRGEDAIRYLVETVRSATTTKTEPPTQT